VRRRGRWRDRLVDLYQSCILLAPDGRSKPFLVGGVSSSIMASIYRSTLPSAWQNYVATKATIVDDLRLVSMHFRDYRIETASWPKVFSSPVYPGGGQP